MSYPWVLLLKIRSLTTVQNSTIPLLQFCHHHMQHVIHSPGVISKMLLVPENSTLAWLAHLTNRNTFSTDAVHWLQLCLQHSHPSTSGEQTQQLVTGYPHSHQSVKNGKSASETTIMSTGVPQGCVLSPLLSTLMTHDCCAKHNSNHIKFTNDTTVVGLISNYDDSTRFINSSKGVTSITCNSMSSKEISVDFRKKHTSHTPLTMNGSAVESVKSIKFLGYTSQTTTNTTSIVKKAQQCLHFLHRMNRVDTLPINQTTCSSSYHARLSNSFFRQAFRLLNSLKKNPWTW